jgi:hypothetical protein
LWSSGRRQPRGHEATPCLCPVTGQPRTITRPRELLGDARARASRDAELGPQ